MDPMTMMALATLASSVIGGLTSGKGDVQNVPTRTKQQRQFQENALNQANALQQPGGGYNQAMQQLQDYLNPESELYKNFEKPYMQQFEQQIVPGLAERFAGFGGGMGGGLSSSGFGQAIGAAGGNLMTNLAQMKSQMGRQSINDLLNQYNQLSQTGLMQNFQPVMQNPATFGTEAAKGAASFFPNYFASQMNNQAPTASQPGNSNMGFPNPGYGGNSQFNLPDWHY